MILKSYRSLIFSDIPREYVNHIPIPARERFSSKWPGIREEMIFEKTILFLVSFTFVKTFQEQQKFSALGRFWKNLVLAGDKTPIFKISRLIVLHIS